MTVEFLKTALELAEIRRGFCAPNPSVGAVVVKKNHIIASGYHFASGHPHAEVEALRAVREKTDDVTLYVTLEPCCHRNKKTPPCTDLLIERGIKKVVYGFRDPNPAVAGMGEKTLQAADIECVYYPIPEIDEFYRSYQHWWQTQTPFVTAKLAMSLDGKIAGENGERITITSHNAQQFTHLQRKRSDAILTTAQTIIVDDPLLNARIENEIVAKPLYILDRQLKTPLTANIFQSAKSLTFFHDDSVNAQTKALFEQHNVRCVMMPTHANKLDLTKIIKFIGSEGVHDLWIEAGGQCFSAFAGENLLQCGLIYVAPKWLGETAQAAFDKADFFAKAHQMSWHALNPDAMCKLLF